MTNTKPDKTETSLPSEGMPLTQLIAMLMAAQAQGATVARIARREADGNGRMAGVDWVSPEPVEGCVYLGCMETWDDMGHTALESLDW